MKNRIVLSISAAAMAAASLSVNAQMKNLTDQALQDIHGQGYIVTVGANNYGLPFAYEVIASKAPGWVLGPQQNFVATITPGYPAEVDEARSYALARVNGKLSATTSYLQTLPVVSGWVQPVSISTAMP